MAHILVIEDDRTIREVIRTLLEMESHQVTEAEDGKEALELLETINVDIVITDIFLPRLSGIKVIKILKKQNSKIKIIAISGAGNGAYNLQSLTEIGADRFLEKPFEMGELLNAIKELSHQIDACDHNN